MIWVIELRSSKVKGIGFAWLASDFIGALSLDTKNLKLQLMHEAGAWKVAFSENLHIEALEKMNALNDYMKVTDTRLKREVVDLDSLRYVMNVLKEIRERESGIDMEIMPVMDMYDMLEQFLPEGYMDTSEMDQKSVIRSTWKRMVNKAEVVTDDLGKLQMGFKNQFSSIAVHEPVQVSRRTLQVCCRHGCCCGYRYGWPIRF